MNIKQAVWNKGDKKNEYSITFVLLDFSLDAYCSTKCTKGWYCWNLFIEKLFSGINLISFEVVSQTWKQGTKLNNGTRLKTYKGTSH